MCIDTCIGMLFGTMLIESCTASSMNRILRALGFESLPAALYLGRRAITTYRHCRRHICCADRACRYSKRPPFRGDHFEYQRAPYPRLQGGRFEYRYAPTRPMDMPSAMPRGIASTMNRILQALGDATFESLPAALRLVHEPPPERQSLFFYFCSTPTANTEGSDGSQGVTSKRS